MSGCGRLEASTLSAFLDRELPAEASAEVSLHLESCAACGDVLARLADLEEALRALPSIERGPGFERGFRERVARATGQPRAAPARVPLRRRRSLRVTSAAAAAVAAALFALLLLRPEPDDPLLTTRTLGGEEFELVAAAELDLALDPDLELLLALDVLEVWEAPRSS
jgi:anti-sigma factor RsiW